MSSSRAYVLAGWPSAVLGHALFYLYVIVAMGGKAEDAMFAALASFIFLGLGIPHALVSLMVVGLLRLANDALRLPSFVFFPFAGAVIAGAVFAMLAPLIDYLAYGFAFSILAGSIVMAFGRPEADSSASITGGAARTGVGLVVVSLVATLGLFMFVARLA